jgi:hypothetical protein
MRWRCVRASSLGVEFFPRNMDVHFMSDPPAPSAGARVVEHRRCLVSILIDSRTRLQFVRTVDLSRHAVVLAWRDLLGFGEVIQAVDPVGK